MRVLVLGGYGHLGAPLCETLVKNKNITVIIAGRSAQKAARLADKIKTQTHEAKVETCQLDWESNDFFYQLEGVAPFIVIHAGGAYHNIDYTVAQACIDLKIHYIDFSNIRDHVNQIIELDESAKSNDVIVISGASITPGLSSAVIEKYQEKFSILREIDFGISMSNQSEKAEATMHTLLHHAGKPFQRLEGGEWKEVYGWQNLHQHYYGDNIGLRWHSNMDVPDLDLLPKRYPTLKTVVFHTGFELTGLHFLMWNLSWLSRAKLVHNWSKYSSIMTRVNRWFKSLGTKKTGIYVHLYGASHTHQPFDVNWSLISEEDHGKFIAIVGAIILVNKILEKKINAGAMPCVALFTLEEFETTMAAQNWNIYSTVEEQEF